MKYILNYSTTQEAKARETIPEERSVNCISKERHYGMVTEGIDYDNTPDNFTEDGWYRYDDDTREWSGPYVKSETTVKGKYERYPDIHDCWQLTSPDDPRQLYGYWEGSGDNHWSYILIVCELLRVEGDVYILGDYRGRCYMYVMSDFKGGCSSIVPGVAYNREEEDVYYNIPPVVEFDADAFPGYMETPLHVTWEEAGVDSSMYETYLKMVKNPKTDQSQWNVFAVNDIDRLQVTRAYYMNGEVTLYLSSCRQAVVIRPDGFYLQFDCDV